MASRFLGVGNIIGYAAGYINLTRYLWFLGDTQFKDLCAFGSIALASSILLSVLTIRERDPRLEGPPPADRPGVFNFFGKVFTSIKRLPPQTRKVCIIQFFSWIGFFPLIFYTSEYIAEMYVDPLLRENPNMSDEELDRLYELATRVGTFALLMNAVASFLTNLLLPFFVEPTYDTKPVFDEEPNGSPVANGKDYDDDETQTFLSRLVIPGFTLRRAWMLALILYSLVIFCTVIVRSVSAATVLIGLTGISWALALWAPWAIIAAEISRLDAVRRARKAAQERLAIGDGSGNGIDETLDGDISSLPVQPQSGAGPSGPAGDDLGGAGGDGSSGSINRSKGPAAVATEEVNDDEPDQAGVVLGIHNMAIAAPQMISTFISSIIFRLFQKPRNVPGDRSIAMTLALGGFTVLVAAWFVHTLRDEVATVPADLLAAAEDGDSEVLIVSTGSLRGAGSSSPAAGENVLASSVLSTASRASRSRRQSSEAQRRRSMERATLARSSSFGSGLEY